MILTRSQSKLELTKKIEQLKVKLQNTESQEQFNHLLIKLIRLFGEKTTKENVVMIYRLLVNNHGKELVRTKLCCKQVIFNKIYENYYLHDAKEFYQIYRDLFGRRIPDQEYYKQHLYDLTIQHEDINKNNTKLFDF